MGANSSLARRPTHVVDDGGGEGDGSKRRRTRRSHSMPVNPPDRLAPSATQRRPAPKGITAKGRSVYAAVRHRLTGNGSKQPAVPLPPICRVPPALKGKAARDHAKTFRELVSGWSAQDLHCLVVELESALALRELSLRADAARPQAASLRDDMAKLYRSRKCCDVILIYLDREFPVHSSILRRRSFFFHNLLSNTASPKRVKVTFPSNLPMSAEKFNSLLLYLYTGDLPAELRADVDLIVKLKDHFGTPHSFEADMFSILEQSASNGDATLLFTASHNPVLGESMEIDSEQPSTSSASSQVNEGASGRTYAVRCDAATVAARSPLLRALLERRRAASEELTIVLDENVIPRIYAPVIMHAMHTDHVDLSKVMRGCLVSASSLSEVQAIASGKCQISPIDQATDIYHIAGFLEFDRLAQGCEDVIVNHMTVDCLASVYSWAVESGGSAFVRRSCVNLLCQEFSRVANSPVLFDLDEELLVETLRSDFVQASELEILQAVIRWGEHQLVRRMEEREPNILSGTTHSITRKGVRRADLSDHELKEILWRLLPLIRIDFILPPFHQSLTQAISRGLVCCPPPDLAGTSRSGSDSSTRAQLSASGRPSEVPTVEANPDHHWLHPLESHRAYKGPRLFVPYLEEARSQLNKRLQENPHDAVQLRAHTPSALPPLYSHSHYPDTLYMVRNGRRDSDEGGDCWTEHDGPLPDIDDIDKTEQRVATVLRASTTVQKALACGCAPHRKAVVKQVRLRVLRELDFPDQLVKVLRHPSLYYDRPRRPIVEERSRSHRFRSEPGLNCVGGAWPDLMDQCPHNPSATVPRYTVANESIEDLEGAVGGVPPPDLVGDANGIDDDLSLPDYF